ncbi:MAG TPA: PqqD family protein [Vicinamibacterales bacterium]|nr:PqqD family protein [Vicinamibacterales bacterium]
MPASLDATVRVPDSTVFHEIDGETVLLQLEAGMYYGLDAVGTRLWQLMVQHASLRTVFETALAEFDVSPEQLERDLLDLVEQLEARGLLALD